MSEAELNRRHFMKVLGTVPAVAIASQATGVSIVVDPADGIAATKPAKWAIERLAQALKTRTVAVTQVAKLQDAGEGSLCIIAAGAQNATAQPILREAGVSVATAPEALGLINVSQRNRPCLLACGHDSRGLVYALTELADVVQNAPDPMAALGAVKTNVEQPANKVRSIVRMFCSDIEDKPWYNDRAMWPEYFDMLATQRFNRFNLAFGIGYNGVGSGVKDGYFLFAYPFLVKVPGYNVRVVPLPDEEREHNLEMLKYISEQCVARGMEFHLGLWMHGWDWTKSKHANYVVHGLDESTHGPYCRDAVKLLLREVPHIHGLTFRIHGEAGIAEGSFDFWKTVFEGVATCGRQVPIDLHPKGMSQEMIDVLLGTKEPLSMTPKCWAEHLGLPYQLADIRAAEKPKAENKPEFFSLSHGTRSFLRYSYGDLLAEDRKWTVMHRVVIGTRRLLLWGDPRFTAAYSRASGFCSSDGAELQEPLSFKGMRGSGHPGSRCAYADATYDPRWDWQKFEYTLRLWGRLQYNPGTRPEVWRRWLQRQFGPGAMALENGLASVTRILPTVTSAYSPSAAKDSYWPELYTNQSMFDAEHYGPYADSPQPRVFGNASPLDPAMFLSMNAYADELLKGTSSGKYSPVEAAQWIEDFAAAGRAALAQAEASARGRDTVAYRRAKVDIEIQAGLGEFFGAKFRSGVLFHLYEVTRERPPLEACIAQYKKARTAFAALAEVADGVYMTDIGWGIQPHQHGHWLDRLPAIDQDIAAVSAMLGNAKAGETSPKVNAAMRVVLGRPHRVSLGVQHGAPAHFTRGEKLTLTLSAGVDIAAVRLHYRHVNQAENYVTAEMERRNRLFGASIPGAYTETVFPLEYYFEVQKNDGKAGLHPGFTPELTNQPYYVVRSV